MRQCLPPAFSLAAACATWPPSAARIAAIQRAAAEIDDWDQFLRVAIRHRIAGLVQHGLREASVALPRAVHDRLARKTQAVAMKNIRMASEAVRLRRAFAEADIPIAFLKGATLAALAYGSLHLRHAKDIDILVREQDIFAGAALLERLGYRRIEPDPRVHPDKLPLWIRRFKHFSYVDKERRNQVELHWRLSDNPLLIAVPPASTWRDVAIAPGITLPTLATDDLLAYLCIHGASHAWYRLKWLADVRALMAAEVTTDAAERVLAVARSRGAERPAGQALLLAHRLFGSSLPASFLSADQAPRTMRMLAAMALTAMTRGDAEAEAHDLPFGTTLVLASEYFFKGWRFRWAQLHRDLAHQDDWLLLSLPTTLNFLYPLLRLPLWTMRRISRGGRSRAPW